jgi:hypothetical protein
LFLEESQSMDARSSIIRPTGLIVAMSMAIPAVGLQSGCTTPQAIASVPAIQGTVLASGDGNGDTSLSLRVRHLAPPSLAAADATLYVAWIQTPGAAKHNIGALTLNDRLEGSLDTVTPHRRFLLSVTPEPGGGFEQPTHDPVFTAEVNRRE